MTHIHIDLSMSATDKHMLMGHSESSFKVKLSWYLANRALHHNVTWGVDVKIRNFLRKPMYIYRGRMVI
jgi:hypothetical protein